MAHHTCRYSKCPHPHGGLIRPDDAEIRTGKRHYMHADCYVRSGKPFSALSHPTAGALPYFVVKDCGRLDELVAYLAAPQKRNGCDA